MARPEKNRKIHRPPLMEGYKPFGIPLCEIEKINLTFEEHESIRLVLYKNLQQEPAAEQMNVSRPTLTRIYNKALKKIAIAFMEGKAIEFEGGNYEFDQEWYRCKRCHKLIENPEAEIECETCTDDDEDELICLNNREKHNSCQKKSNGQGLKRGERLGRCRKTQAESVENQDFGATNGKQCQKRKCKRKHHNK